MPNPDLISITFKFDVDSRGVVKKYDKSKAGTAFGSFLNDSKLDSYVARTGYDFAGWYTGEKNGEKIGSDTARPSEDTTYYARWQIRTVTIRLGGTVGKNYGYIGIYKGGSFSDNYGVIDNNKGKLSYNYNLLMKNSGELDNNEGLLSLNTGLLHNNRAGAETNKGTIDYNYGVLKVNDETGEVGANSGRDRFCC